MIVQQGQINTTALLVPDLYVQIVPPSTQYLNGVPTNVAGFVGTATWGPINSAVTAGTPAQAQAIFGPPQVRKYDLMTALLAAVQQGASNFRLVRVTDGADTAATIVVQTNCITFTSKYTGSFGNNITVTLSIGTQANSVKVVVAAVGLQPESFDNIGPGLSGNALWIAIANAINNGLSATRGASQIIVATAGVGVTAPTMTAYTLASGTDGVSSVTDTSVVGTDGVARTGMYALRNNGVSVAALVDVTTTATFATQITFGLSEGIYMVGVTAAGDTPAAYSSPSSRLVDSYSFKAMLGDWVYWLDTYNQQIRLISPQGFVVGMLANLSPQNSTLNKPMQGVVGTQKSYANQVYSSADLQNLAQVGMDVISNPQPGGYYFGCRFGHNTSSNAVIHGDNYTRMTNYIASTLNAGMGRFVGQLQSLTVQQQAAATLSAFFDSLWRQQMIGNSNGTVPYSVEIDAANNPQSRVALGYMQADVKVQYLSVIEYFLVNVEGGQSVQINRQQISLA